MQRMQSTHIIECKVHKLGETRVELMRNRNGRRRTTYY